MPIFGASKPRRPMTTPGYGDSIAPDIQVPADLGRLAPVSRQQPGFGGFVDRLFNPDPTTTAGKIGMFGAHLGAQLGSPLGTATLGMQEQQAQTAREQLQDRIRALMLEREEREANEPRVMSGPGGAILSVDRQSGAVTPLYTPPPEAPKPTTLEQQIAFLRSLDPSMTDAEAAEVAERSMSGFRYSPEYQRETIETAAEIADRRAAANARHRAPPGGRTGSAPNPPAGFILD